MAGPTFTCFRRLWVGRTEKKKERKKEEDEQFGCLANFQFSTLAMVFCEFNSLVGYRTTGKEG